MLIRKSYFFEKIGFIDSTSRPSAFTISSKATKIYSKKFIRPVMETTNKNILNKTNKTNLTLYYFVIIVTIF